MAAEGAAAAAAVAAGAFSYNRENYLYDAEFRWERFSSAREYANQQAEQYRGDLRTLAALTVKKNTLWCVTATLCMALCVALYCAGRLGLHGPSPPAWIMGLWLTNNAAAFGFMALCIFLALHASFRAQAASTQLLTRKTRVPVPTLRQLDEARRFASEFEQQSWGDIFRIPYVTHNGAPKTDDAVYEGDAGEQSPSGSGGRARSAPPSRSGRAKASSWVREEFEKDRVGQGAAVPPDTAPEHFQLWTAVQKEFYQHDIYARICIFYGFIHYVQSLCYYGLGHINIELRAFWVAYGCAFVIAVLMALMLRFDIVPANPDKKQYLPRCEYLGPLAILPAAIGMSLDFQVQFDPTAIAVCWVMIFIAYILQLLYALRMLELILPDETFAGPAERLGASYLPEGWRKVPSSFYHVLYFVAPPTKLQPGQNDIVREIKNGGGGAYDEVVGAGEKGEKASRKAGSEDDIAAIKSANQTEPWKLATGIAATLPVSWCFLIFGCIIDAAIGEQALVTAPHWSRPPMTRLSKRPHELGTPIGFPWAAGTQPWIPEQMAWHEEKRHAETYNFNRRLSAEPEAPVAPAAMVTAALKGLLAALPSDGPGPAAATAEPVDWPSFFEPKLLACSAGGHVAALTPRGFGAIAPLGTSHAAEPFALGGLTHVPPLVGAAGHGEGLLLASCTGHLLECPGPRPASGAVWACAPSESMPTMLPVADSAQLLAATAAVIGGRLHAALVHEGEPDLIALFAQEAKDWLPLGELRIPGAKASTKPSLAFVGEDIMVATDEGFVLRRRLSDGATVGSAHHAVRHEGAAWQGACMTHHGPEPRIAHLRLRQTGHTWQPELLTAEIQQTASGESKPAFFA